MRWLPTATLPSSPTSTRLHTLHTKRHQRERGIGRNTHRFCARAHVQVACGVIHSLWWNSFSLAWSNSWSRSLLADFRSSILWAANQAGSRRCQQWSVGLPRRRPDSAHRSPVSRRCSGYVLAGPYLLLVGAPTVERPTCRQQKPHSQLCKMNTFPSLIACNFQVFDPITTVEK
jgi:hypothetical protein